MRREKPMRKAIALTCIATAGFATSAAWGQSGDHLEIIHHPNYDKSVFMPFSPAIKIKSGKILWLAGGTALPVYHDHPHKREQILKHLPNDLEAQTRQTMDGIMETLKLPARRRRTWCTCSSSVRGRAWATSARRAPW